MNSESNYPSSISIKYRQSVFTEISNLRFQVILALTCEA